MLETSPAAPGSSERAASYKKKLIEVAIPLQAINAAAAPEKSNPPKGHPARMHQWWARRPLAACRAVLFASLVDDPSSNPERFPTPEDQERERKRLFELIEQLVQPENSLNELVLAQAHEEIRNSFGELPTVYDPFCGGGAIPIEAQRLGLPTLASDLNPVAVLITRALTEIPWRFKGYAPVHPLLQGPLRARSWERATGLASDVEAYGKWMLEQARKRIGHFYPSIRLRDEREATVTAWLWARVVRCPNPLCGAQMPLIKSRVLSTKKGSEWYLEPIVDCERKTVRFETRKGNPSHGGTVTRRGAVCIVCNEPVSLSYIRSEGKAQRIAEQMIAIVANGAKGRVYLPPDDEHDRIARSARPTWAPDTDLPARALGFRVQAYGMTKHRDLFTSRQLLALTTFSDLVSEGRRNALVDAIAAGLQDDGKSLEAGGAAATAYADAVATFLAFLVSRTANYGSSLATWNCDNAGRIRAALGDKKVPPVWDFAEANPFGSSSGNFMDAVDNVVSAIRSASSRADARIFAHDARDASARSAAGARGGLAVVSTDPPYYDNVPYADLSDFFYTWLRRCIGDVYPDLLASLLVPKTAEIVVDSARFNGNGALAEQFFQEGLLSSFQAIAKFSVPQIPTTLFYAYKEGKATEESGGESGIHANGGRVGRTSAGWESMLSALLDSGFQIMGTWPIRTERRGRQRALESNALASSITLTCRLRDPGAQRCSRVDFIRNLRAELPLAVKRLASASIAATDMEQAAIGPGMAVFSQYDHVLENDGTPMSVQEALALINDELAQILLGEIAEVDAETQFALSWFDSHAYGKGRYGDAEVLLKAKNVTLETLKSSGVVEAERGVVRLLAPRELQTSEIINGGRVRHMPVWATLVYTMAALNAEDGGEQTAAHVLRLIGADNAETLKSVAYHCYVASNRLKRSVEAQDFNALVTAWPELERLSKEDSEQRLL